MICLSCEKQLSVGANCIIIMHISCQHNVLVVDFLNAFNITVYFFPISFLSFFSFFNFYAIAQYLVLAIIASLNLFSQ